MIVMRFEERVHKMDYKWQAFEERDNNNSGL